MWTGAATARWLRSAGRNVRWRLAVAALLAVGCAAPRSPEEAEPVPARTIEQTLAQHSASLMAVPGVVGTAVGRCDGTPCIRVFLARDDPDARARIPGRLDGYPVRTEVTGPIRARD